MDMDVAEFAAKKVIRLVLTVALIVGLACSGLAFACGYFFGRSHGVATHDQD